MQSLSLFESVLVALFTWAVVFGVLISLWVLIRLVSAAIKGLDTGPKQK